MPSNDIFSFQLLINNTPVQEYPASLSFPTRGLPNSSLDRVVCIQAEPTSEFTLRITYLGETTRLDPDNAWSVYLYIDGHEVDLILTKQVDGRVFSDKRTWNATINGKSISDGLEQVFVVHL
jgi:hypothetical protein